MSKIQPERTLSSETVFSGKLIDVRRDTVSLPGGKSTTREIVVHPEVVAMLPTLDDGRLVLVRQYRKPAERVLLEIPAGGIEDGETPEDAVRREMREETGYRVGKAEPLATFYSSPGFTTELMHLFRCSGLEPGQPTESTDELEVVLLTPEQARDCWRNGEIADAKSILALLYAAIHS